MRKLEKYKLLISVLIGLLLSITAVVIWGYNKIRVERSLAGKVADTGKLIVQQFDGTLRDYVNRLENLKHRLEITEGGYFEYWNLDAARIVENESTFKFVEWIDSTMIIQRVEPYTGNEEAVGLDISVLDYRNSDWLKAKQDSVFNMTHWLELVQGDYAFLVDEPVYINDTFYGTITAGMDFTSRFNNIMQGLDEYHVKITDDQGTEFYTFGSSEGTESFRNMAVTSKIQIQDANQSTWTVTIVPNHLFADLNAFANNNIVLGLVIILCMFLAVSFFLTLKSSEAERISKNANDQLRELIEAAPIGIYVIDSEGNVVDFWNSAAEKMLGWKREEVLGKFLPHITSEYKEDFKRIMNDIRENGGVSNYEVRRKRKDGTERIFRLHVSKVIGEEEQMMVLLEEITKEKEYEERLENSLEEKNILLSEVHHRVKNNLAIIVGLIELQNAEVTDETTKSNLHETKNRIYSISGVHELLYQTDNFIEIGFVEYINELVERLQQTYENNNNPVTIHKDITGVGVNINQAIPLGLMLNELITNSYKHAFDGISNPEIFFELKEDNGFVEIIYEDNGKGFEKEIFEKATSLGVTIIKTSLSQLSAEYEIFSKPGFGIRFRFPVQLKGAHSTF